MDNVFIERLWRSLKYECVYLHAFETGSELRAGLSKWIGYYNARRPHSTLAGRTPDEAYRARGTQAADGTETEKLAAWQQPEPSLSQPQSCPKKQDHLRSPQTNPASDATLVGSAGSPAAPRTTTSSPLSEDKSQNGAMPPGH